MSHSHSTPSVGHSLPIGCFPADYADSRRRFREAAAAAGFEVDSWRNPQPGPAGEALATDVVRIGPADAGRVLFTMSATHGVEGYCGAGIQLATLSDEAWRALPPDTALVMIHAINPYGFAWLRRVNEDNVDLNRNHVDHSAPYPDNPGYRELRDAICPPDWGGPVRETAEARLAAYAQAHGMPALQHAVTGGQYSDPAGVFFGGHALTWSALTLYGILDRYTQHARHVGFIDFHTGLGPFGHGELICDHPSSHPAFRRLRDWLGDDITSLAEGDSSSAPLTGTNGHGIEQRIGGERTVTMVTLEFGTQPITEVIECIRADCWLHNHGEPDSDRGRKIKAALRHCFYPDKDEWKEQVLERARMVQRSMLRGLGGVGLLYKSPGTGEPAGQ